MKRLTILLLVCCSVLVLRADIGYKYLEFNSTSSYITSRYSATLSQDIQITSVGATGLDVDEPHLPFRPRHAYGPSTGGGIYGDDEDFFDDDEGFDGVDDDRYTTEPGELPVGNLPWLFMLLLAWLYANTIRGNRRNSMCRETL